MSNDKKINNTGNTGKNNESADFSEYDRRIDESKDYSTIRSHYESPVKQESKQDKSKPPK